MKQRGMLTSVDNLTTSSRFCRHTNHALTSYGMRGKSYKKISTPVGFQTQQNQQIRTQWVAKGMQPEAQRPMQQP